MDTRANIAEAVAATAWREPDRPCVFLGTDPLHTYGSFAQRVARLAGGLRSLARPGDRVAIAMTNRPEYLELLFATWWAGLVAVPVNRKLHPSEIVYIADHCDVTLLFCDQDAALREALPASRAECLVLCPDGRYQALLQADPLPLQPVAPDDLAWIFYTSGTTGRPKGARLSHRNLSAMARSYVADIAQVTPADRHLYAAPMSHGAGLYSVVFMAGGAAHVFLRSGRFDPAELLSTASAHRHVTVFAVPTMIRRLVREATTRGVDPAAFRTIVYGGAPMYVDDLRQARAVLGGCLVQIYGQGEAPMTISTLSQAEHLHHDDRVLASVGRPFSTVEVRLCDADGKDVQPDTPGEVLVKGDVVMDGYWRDEQATGEALRDGWLRTGDIGTLDATGRLTLLDRSKDVIISGGSNIYPREVEEVLQTHPGVADVSVVGEPDPEWGERVVAYVVPEPGVALETEALDRHCLAHLARFKRPKAYRFLAALPRNTYGKVVKARLR
ncbi:AMP-binding protein [Nonomuraea indica]|uniref:AMP-binding protein n=1 Tax=Nonomuraea indica TaxID=1581193 RepID=UPI000C7A5355|nr:AMP-binding protein [Nonomuraea indica]